MSNKLRISPSGPFLKNANGGDFEPGAGARLRLVEATSTIGAGTAIIPTAPTQLSSTLGGTFNVAMANPDPLLNYRVHVQTDVGSASTNVPAAVELYIDYSVDGGATWAEAVSNTHTVNPSTVSGTSRQVSLDMTLRAGSSLSVTGAPQTAELRVRARIGASAGGGTAVVQGAATPGSTRGVGTILLQLEECF